MTSRFCRRQMPAEHSDSPLAGVRVVDLSNTLMVPFTTLLMAQMGAEVIKVEPAEGDILRRVGDVTGTGLGPVFINANYGKKSVVLDVKSSEGYESLKSLIGDADVFVHNRTPKAAKELKIDYPSVSAGHARLIYCTACGYGRNGPYRDLPAYDDVVQAASGMAHLQTNLGTPQYVRTAMADKTTALFVLAGILAALYERERSGLGQELEVPMFESMLSFLMLEHQGGAVFEPPNGPTGYVRMSSEHRHPYRTSDGLIGVMIYTDSQWKRFFSLIGVPELADDPRFATMTQRTVHTDELYSLVESALASATTTEWIMAFRERQIPAMQVNSIEDVFDDEHVRAAGIVEDHEDPVMGTTRSVRLPISFSRSSRAPILRPPLLGEHTRISSAKRQRVTH
jgi:crotonobetainyl-CoA:carnitine CoA-transferase CaiB-like acyl-CoA transferase